MPLSPSQTVVALTLDDVMMAIDAIRHRETQLTKRAALIDAESSHGLFLASAFGGEHGFNGAMLSGSEATRLAASRLERLLN